MNSPRRNRDRKPARRTAFKLPLPRILVVCEGRNTEPQYLKGFVRACENPRVDIEIAGKHGVPLTVVRTARDLKRKAESSAKQEADSNLEYDEVWCVFDIDDHPAVPEATHLARSNGIELAISNPSFELWLLLHFRGDPGPKHRVDIRELLLQYVPDYDKSVDYIRDYNRTYDAAKERAKRLHDAAEEDRESGRNPTTGVYRLTQSIALKPDEK